MFSDFSVLFFLLENLIERVRKSKGDTTKTELFPEDPVWEYLFF